MTALPESTANSAHSSTSKTAPHPSNPRATTSSSPAKDSSSKDDILAEKRRRNTLASRRFRQKQQDRIAELEQALHRVSKERDDLKMQVARWEGETVALRAMLAERRLMGK
jgi:hypothetical protein